MGNIGEEFVNELLNIKPTDIRKDMIYNEGQRYQYGYGRNCKKPCS